MKYNFVHLKWALLSIPLFLSQYKLCAQNTCTGNNLLQNGSFETPVVPVTGGANNIRPSTQFAPWINNSLTADNINVVRMIGGSSPNGPDTAAQGNQYIDLLGATGIMDQKFTLTAPGCFNFSGYFANRQYPANAPQSQVGIQLFDKRNIEVAVKTGGVGAVNQYNWVPVQGISSLMQPGQYTFRFFGRNDLLHYDDMRVCLAATALSACSNASVLLNPGNWTATANTQFNASFGPALAINSNLNDAVPNCWAVNNTAAGTAAITIDYQQALDLIGFVYYPRSSQEQDVKGYEVAYSNDGINFTSIQQGSLEQQGRIYPSATGNPVIQPFTQAVTARYLRFIIINSHYPNNPIAVQQLLPIVCNAATPIPTIACGNANLLNSGTTSNGTAKKAKYTFDNYWKVAYYGHSASLTYTEAKALTYLPAIVSGNAAPTAWVNSPFGNAEWISYSTSGYDVNSIGPADGSSPNFYFYKYNFNLADPYLVQAFKLKIDFYVDNSVHDIYINGVSQAARYNLPRGGFNQNSRVSTELDNSWLLGNNEILVKTFSQPGFNGFLIQNVANCVGVDFGDAPATYGIDRNSNGPGHVIETVNNAVQICLGNTVAPSMDGMPSLLADSDSTDEDGIIGSFPGISHTVNPIVNNYQVIVKVKNTTGKSAHLVGWIDWNRNGVFDTTEGVSALVPNNTTTATLTWPTATFIGDPATDRTYARFRISTDSLTVANQLGAASDGEVEDYHVQFPALCEQKVMVPTSNNNWSASISVPSLNTEVPKTIDGLLQDGNQMVINYSNLPAEIVYDYGAVQQLGGFVYYPNFATTAAGRLDMEAYDVLLSNDNFSYTLVTTGAITMQTMATANRSTQTPRKVLFPGGTNARYMKIVVKQPTAVRNVAILELLPIMCQEPAGFTAGCGTAPLFNTGTSANGTAPKTLATFDHKWEVTAIAKNAAVTYAQVKDSVFLPAVVVGNKAPVSWANSPFGNAEWISMAPSGHDASDSMDYFFKLQFELQDTYEWSAFHLNMDFFADNSVQNIYINGVGIAPAQSLPQSASYMYDGFTMANRAQVALQENYRLGLNEMVVHIRSNTPYNGFLAQNTTNCTGIDFGDAPLSYNVSRAQYGAGHIIDTVNGGTTLLYMGSYVDGEADGIQSATALADDNNQQTNDEDGVQIDTLEVSYCNSNSYSVTISATNLTADSALIVGWIDFDGNGTFDAAEAATTHVPPMANNQNVLLAWQNQAIAWPVNTAQTYARFRIATEGLSDASANGLLANGEVEDYVVPMQWIHHDFGNLDANIFPVAACITQDLNAVRLGEQMPNYECSTLLDDTADGVFLSPAVSGTGHRTNPWLVDASTSQLELQLVMGAGMQNQPLYWAVWIDWNGNGRFDDSTDGFSTGNTTYIDTSLVIPLLFNRSHIDSLGPAYIRSVVTAAPAGFTAAMNASGVFANGEVEDYYLEFVSPLPQYWRSFKGAEKGKYHQLDWQFEAHQEAITSFEVELMHPAGAGNPISLGKLPFREGQTDYTFAYIPQMQAAPYLYRIIALQQDRPFSQTAWLQLGYNAEAAAVMVYPNPFEEVIHLTPLPVGAVIQVVNILGQVMYTATADQGYLSVHTAKWPAGMYLVQISHGSHWSTHKVWKR